MVPRYVAPILGALLALVPSATSADDAKFAAAGSQFQVNTYTTDGQQEPAVAMHPDGGFVIVWTSTGSSGTDYRSSIRGGGPSPTRSIQGQRYAADGTAAGSQFQVNTFTTDDQYEPAVSMAPNGDFVVVWDSSDFSGMYTQHSLFGQRYASDGSPIGGEFLVDTHTSGSGFASSVAVADDGSFIVVWRSTDPGGIRGRRYASDGSALASELQINSYTTGSHLNPKVAVDGEGDFVVVWDSSESLGTDTDFRSVQGQRFASDGSPLGGPFQVNTFTSDSQSDPAVAVAAEGQFVVVWESDGSFGTDSNYESIQGQRFASDGSMLGSQFQVNSYTSAYEIEPSVMMDALGNFAVVWQSGGGFAVADGVDGAASGVAGQRYNSDGSPLGGEFVINSYTTSNQDTAAIGMTPHGDFVVAWESIGSPAGPGRDTDVDSVQAQRYTLSADLSITKTDGVTVADPGGTVVYTLVASNAGPDAAVATVTDNFPSLLTCTWVSMAMGGATGNVSFEGEGIDEVLVMPAGSSVTYTVTCDIDAAASGTLTNTATILSAVSDPVPVNNIATDDDTVLTPQANVGVAKTGPGVAEPLAQLIYILRVTNEGPLDAPDVSLIDALPPGTTFISASGGGFSCGHSGGMVTCTRALLPASAVATVTVLVLAPASEGEIMNVASVGALATDFDASNDTSTLSTAIAAPIFTDGFESGNTSVWANTVE